MVRTSVRRVLTLVISGLAVMAFMPGGVQFGRLRFAHEAGLSFASLRIEDFAALRDAMDAEMQREEEHER